LDLNPMRSSIDQVYEVDDAVWGDLEKKVPFSLLS
jgi:hypothetical protein